LFSATGKFLQQGENWEGALTTYIEYYKISHVVSNCISWRPYLYRL